MRSLLVDVLLPDHHPVADDDPRLADPGPVRNLPRAARVEGERVLVLRKVETWAA